MTFVFFPTSKIEGSKKLKTKNPLNASTDRNSSALWKPIQQTEHVQSRYKNKPCKMVYPSDQS